MQHTTTGPRPAIAQGIERPLRLGRCGRGLRGAVVGLKSPDWSLSADPAELERRLLEMGFVEGARVELLHEGPIGRDPIAVRVDDTTVALRRRDADMILIQPLHR
jgi:ferrous iron transport protein A